MPYIPAEDEVTDPAVMEELVARHPLASLVTHDGTTPECDLVPLLLVPDEGTPTGRALIGHVARANPLWQEGHHEGQTLATFGPAEHYVSPSWYRSTSDDQRAVPTWDYLVVHAWGPLEVHEDPRWMRAAVAHLTVAMESRRDHPWRLGQAPKDYVDALLADIVGIKIPVQRLVGRFKVSSQKPEVDRLGARDGIAATREGRAWQDLVLAMTDPPQQH